MSLDTILNERSGSKCELCASIKILSIYKIPFSKEVSASSCVLVCENCLKQINDNSLVDTNHWHCINESMWSEYIPVQVLSYRILKTLNNHSWAQDLIEQLYLEDEIKAWADSGAENQRNQVQSKGSNGSDHLEDDSV